MLDTLKAIQPNMTHLPRLERPPTFTTHPSRIAFLMSRGLNCERESTLKVKVWHLGFSVALNDFEWIQVPLWLREVCIRVVFIRDFFIRVFFIHSRMGSIL